MTVEELVRFLKECPDPEAEVRVAISLGGHYMEAAPNVATYLGDIDSVFYISREAEDELG